MKSKFVEIKEILKQVQNNGLTICIFVTKFVNLWVGRFINKIEFIFKKILNS